MSKTICMLLEEKQGNIKSLTIGKTQAQVLIKELKITEITQPFKYKSIDILLSDKDWEWEEN